MTEFRPGNFAVHVGHDSPPALDFLVVRTNPENFLPHIVVDVEDVVFEDETLSSSSRHPEDHFTWKETFLFLESFQVSIGGSLFLFISEEIF